MKDVNIHPTAIVEKGAELDSGVTVGPYAIIDKHVKIGKNSQIHSHALITGHTTLGDENQVFSYASVGNIPQDLKYKGEPTTLEIGNKNIIREFVTMQPGTVTGISKTVVGHGNLFMAYVHIAHDCIVGNQNVFANLTQLSGHVTVGNMVVFGGFTAIHQFVHVGDMAMTGGNTTFGLDLPPYCIATGNRAGLRGLNVVALQRRGVLPEARAAIKKAYKITFLDGHPTIENAFGHFTPEMLNFAEIKKFMEFIRNSKRGVLRPKDHDKNEYED